MSTEPDKYIDPSLEALPAQREEDDVTGRDRLARNVLASWAGYFVFVVAGFILPRFIDRSIGQAALGVWDFVWAMVSYLELAQAGIGSSVNRYVAKHRADGDIEGLRCTVSSVMCIQLVAAAIIFVLTAVGVRAIPLLLGGRLDGYENEVSWVLALMGARIGIQIAVGVFDGVITGCHRWDLHNLIDAGFYAITVVGMIVALLTGGGLRSLALVYLIVAVMMEFTRVKLAYRVCPGLSVRLRYVRMSQALRMLSFGGKTLINRISLLLLYQTNRILVISYLGPSILALYARPGSLARYAQTFVWKFAFVFTPTASCLQAAGRRSELRDLLVESGRYATYIALPMVLVLRVFGDVILRLWMGKGYEQGLILAILAVGHLLSMTMQPIVNILIGMNAHGRVAVANLIAAICSVGLAYSALFFLGWGLMGAAWAMVIPLMAVYGIYVPIYACRQLEIPILRFFFGVTQGPVLCALPFVGCLVLGLFLFAERPYLGFAVGLGTGSVWLGVIYWLYVIPSSIRTKVISRVNQFAGRFAPAQS